MRILPFGRARELLRVLEIKLGKYLAACRGVFYFKVLQIADYDTMFLIKNAFIPMESDTLAKSIQQHANQCVKCGLCLPHCPTYAITENECESPRGRIALLDALAKQQIALTAKTHLYLDHCLTCRACEAVCPAKVNYGELIDQGRELIVKQVASTPKTSLPKLLQFAFTHRWFWHLLARFIVIYQRTGLQYLVRKSGLLKILDIQRADALLPTPLTQARWRTFYPATTTEQGQVALFTGCINQLVDQATIVATIKILTACGYSVHIPTAQHCCGALYQHAGFSEQAQSCAEVNVNVFNQLPISKIITITTGCAATLQEYAKVTSVQTTAGFAKKIVDINQFLTIINWPNNLMIKPLAKRVVMHTPCTLRNVLKQAHAPIRLLEKIPNLEIIALPASNYCCGAAGQYMLEHPTMSDTLLDKILQQIMPLNADYLVTTNIGCTLHLQKGLSENHLKTRVLHPVIILAEQLELL